MTKSKKILGLGLIALATFLLFSCSEPKTIYVQNNLESITTAISENKEVSDFITPYRDSLGITMNRVIGFTHSDLVRDRPESNLGNFMLDETLDYVLRKSLADSTTPTLGMMNFGGMRSSISRGQITIGDIYALMPFDNIVVVAKLPKTALAAILDYNQNSGGEPIAGFTINGEQLKPVGFDDFGDTIEVVTTDYLFNGGDRMDFFNSAFSSLNTGVLLRDVLIEQVSVKDTLDVVLDQRINFSNE
jgi:2',3'-cyclic-nucleotide 2'-phosphodiesterase (5'-nucleotidase family)